MPCSQGKGSLAVEVDNRRDDTAAREDDGDVSNGVDEVEEGHTPISIRFVTLVNVLTLFFTSCRLVSMLVI